MPALLPDFRSSRRWRLSALQSGPRAALGLRALLISVPLLLAACGGSSAGSGGSRGTSGSSVTTSTSVGSSVTSTTSNAPTTTACTIPQNNGGDHDADNNGGPDDGDGCDK